MRAVWRHASSPRMSTRAADPPIAAATRSSRFNVEVCEELWVDNAIGIEVDAVIEALDGGTVEGKAKVDVAGGVEGSEGVVAPCADVIVARLAESDGPLEPLPMGSGVEEVSG